MSIHDLEILYGDMLAGSMSAAIKWMRHPQVCVSLPKEVVDLIELEISARNDEIASLKKELNSLKKIECQRRENFNQAFGANYSTEKANLMNLPMNPNDLGGDWSSLGMRRSGDF